MKKKKDAFHSALSEKPWENGPASHVTPRHLTHYRQSQMLEKKKNSDFSLHPLGGRDSRMLQKCRAMFRVFTSSFPAPQAQNLTRGHQGACIGKCKSVKIVQKGVGDKRVNLTISGRVGGMPTEVGTVTPAEPAVSSEIRLRLGPRKGTPGGEKSKDLS